MKKGKPEKDVSGLNLSFSLLFSFLYQCLAPPFNKLFWDTTRDQNSEIWLSFTFWPIYAFPALPVSHILYINCMYKSWNQKKNVGNVWKTKDLRVSLSALISPADVCSYRPVWLPSWRAHEGRVLCIYICFKSICIEVFMNSHWNCVQKLFQSLGDGKLQPLNTLKYYQKWYLICN